MTKRSVIALVALIVGLVVLPALAGEGHPCKAGTQECLNKMAANLQHKGIVGVEGEWNDETAGYRIDSFVEGSHAKAVGIRPGDVLVAINGIALNDHDASYEDAENRRPGATASATVQRAGKTHEFTVKLIGLTAQQIAAVVGEHMLQHAEVKLALAN